MTLDNFMRSTKEIGFWKNKIISEFVCEGKGERNGERDRFTISQFTFCGPNCLIDLS